MREMNLRGLIVSLSSLMILASGCVTKSKSEITPEERARRVNAQRAQKRQQARPEPPYPGSQQSDDVATSEPDDDAPRPVAIDEEGNYFYPPTPQPPPRPPPGVEAPQKVDENQNYVYNNPPPAPTFSSRKGVEAPIEIDPSGEFRYSTPPPKSMNRSASFRIGAMTPPTITNPKDGVTYATVYGSSPMPTILGSYEWPLTKKIGQVGIRLSSGITVSSGNGRFVNQQKYGNLLADERFTFISFPNQLTMIYKFQYSDTQSFVPFIEGGAGAFTFTELRDDGLPPKFGAAPTLVGAGGFNFLLDKYDPHGMRQLALDYGIGHAWLMIEFRQYIGLSSNYNYTSSMADLGVIIDF